MQYGGGLLSTEKIAMATADTPNTVVTGSNVLPILNSSVSRTIDFHTCNFISSLQQMTLVNITKPTIAQTEYSSFSKTKRVFDKMCINTGRQNQCFFSN